MRTFTVTCSVIAALVVWNLGCGSSMKEAGQSATRAPESSHQSTTRSPKRFEEPTVEILPSPEQLEDYTAAEEREVFVGEELYELIDGGAVQFFNHGFEWAVAAGYTRVGGDRVTVYVYRMESPAAAASVFTERTLGEAVPAVIGDRSSQPGTSFEFCRGACYVTLVSFEGGEAGKQSTLSLASAIDQHFLQVE